MKMTKAQEVIEYMESLRDEERNYWMAADGLG